VLVDIGDAAVGADIKGPPGRKRLVAIDDAVRGGDGSRRVTQNRVIHAERLREGSVRLRRIDTDREIGDVEVSNLVPTRTE
jgi:hypothetical protein